MNEKTNDKAELAHEHSNEALKLFDEAERLQQAADSIKDAHEHHEAMKKVHSKDREAIAHVRKAVKIDAELVSKQREELREQFNELGKDNSQE